MMQVFKVTLFTVLSGLAIVITIAAITGNKPPLQEIKSAREAISEAKRNNAQIYSTIGFNEAIQKYDSAMLCWNNENRRFILFRNYDKVERLAAEARQLAYNAYGHATINSIQIRENLKITLDSILNAIKYFQKYFNRLPLKDEIIKQVHQGKLLYGEAKMTFDKGDLTTASRKSEQANKLIRDSYSNAEGLLSDYFQKYTEWEKWAGKAVELSKKNKNSCIIIDKYSRECLLFYKGKLKHKFSVELGNNWMGYKNQQGDKSTPEGDYKIKERFSGGQTIYYKALLIDYPNDNDIKRFNVNKKNGSIPTHATIGNLIEIHGHGGKGVDWTNGCVALSDEDMDILFSSCPVGTRVTIVGSLIPLDELLNR